MIEKGHPFLKNVSIYIDEYELSEVIGKLYGDPFSITCCCNSTGLKVFGLGRYGTEIDHYIEDWEDFYYPEPTEEEKKKFDLFASNMGMPKPEIIKETFYE
jgi:hypothetical protein